MKPMMIRNLLSCLSLCLLAACGEAAKPPEQSAIVTAANETAALARLRAIAQAELRYQIESGGEYASLDQLIAKGFVNNPSQGRLPGYRFSVKTKPGGFEATAVPEKFGVTGTRSFYVDEQNVIRGADKKGAEATSSDPEV